MSSSVFRQIASGNRPARAERLFHAAVTAFCALTRPTRAECVQIDDLTLSLLEHVSLAGRRFAAAALSDCAFAPAGLVRRLCEEDVEIAAPLLARSPVLRDKDLIGLIGRHGLAHARVIARRTDLQPAVAALIQALFRSERRGLAQDAEAPAVPATVPPSPEFSSPAAENVRRRLRGMMAGALDPALPAPTDARAGFAHLRDMALLDHRPFFDTALADGLGLPLSETRRIAASPSTLLPALHKLGLTAEQAFLVVAAVLPAEVGSLAGIRALLDAFSKLEAARAEATEPARPASAGDRTVPAAAVLRFRQA